MLDLDAIEARLDRLAIASLTEPTDLETRALVARVRELEAECCELRATLANERGEGEGPSEGWSWSYASGWTLDERGVFVAAVGQSDTGIGWKWFATVPVDKCSIRYGIRDTAPTAREAMRAADKARGTP